jgi:hypothetical protein
MRPGPFTGLFHAGQHRAPSVGAPLSLDMGCADAQVNPPVRSVRLAPRRQPEIRSQRQLR